MKKYLKIKLQEEIIKSLRKVLAVYDKEFNWNLDWQKANQLQSMVDDIDKNQESLKNDDI